MQNILSIKNKTMKLKKGSAEAKRFMAKIRAMRSGTKKKPTKKKATKKIGATKFFEARRLRAKLKAKKNKSKISGVHKDTKSHNVKISVVSGDKNVLLNLAKERDSLIYIIGNLEREIIYFRGDIKWYGKSKANIHIYKNRKSDIEFNKKALKVRKARLKIVDALIKKELKRK